MARFFIEPNQVNENVAEILGADVNHIKNVLRYEVGDTLTLCNGEGMDYECTIENIEKDSIRCSVEESYPSKNEPNRKLVLYQGLPKKDKMELIIQKCVELGVHEIVPVLMERVIVKLGDDKKISKKVERWNKISESAAKQSKRGVMPKVRKPITFKEAMAESQELDGCIMAYENEKNSLRHTLETMKDASSIGLLIGPEGGISDKEVGVAIETGFKSVSLGQRILRTETAGLALTSMIMYAYDEI